MAVHNVFAPLLHTAAADIGWLAAATVLIAYALLMTGRTKPDAIGYLIANALGSLGMGVCMFAQHAWQSVLVNALWLLFGLGPLVKQMRLARARPHQPRIRRGPVSARAVGGARRARTARTCTPNGVARASRRHSASSGSASPSAESRSARSVSACVSQGSGELGVPPAVKA